MSADVDASLDLEPGSPLADTVDDISMEQQPAEQPADEDEAMDDLFGEDNDFDAVKHEDAGTPSSPAGANERLSSPERMQRQAMEYEEEDAPAPVFEQILEAAVNIPNIPLPKSSDGDRWVIRMPNFVKVDSKPFHPDTYVGPEHEDEDLQETSVKEKGMSIKLRVENTMRWKWTKDENGADRRQSNSRIIRWSDGSLSLRLGKELFDITKTIDTSGAVPRTSAGAVAASQSQTQSQPQSQAPPVGRAGLTYLVAQHKRAFILQSEAVIAGHMTLRPTGMQSETHRMLVRAVGQKHNKVARLRMAPDPTRDPEKELMEEMKRDAKRPRKPRVAAGDEDDMNLGARKQRHKSSSGGRRRRVDMWSDEDEDEDEEPVVFSDDEEDGGHHTASPKKKSKEERRGGEYVTDDFVVSDEEGGSDEEDLPRKRRRRAAEEQSEDELDKLDAKIARQEEQRQRQGSGDEDAEGSAVEDSATKGMEVESEEDDDFKVRRAGGTRRKRAIQEDEEDED